MSAERRVTLFTQQKYLLERAKRLPWAGRVAADLLRNNLHGAIPHEGGGIVLSEAKSRGWQVDIGDITSLHPGAMSSDAFQQKESMVFFSALDVTVDHLKMLLRAISPGQRRRIVVGGVGASAAEKELRDEFPEITIAVGRAEGLIAPILDDYSTQGQTAGRYERSAPVDLQLADSEPYFDPELTFRKMPYFANSSLKPLALSDGCRYRCDFCGSHKHPITTKPIPLAIREINLMNLRPQDVLVLIDHNLFNLKREDLIGLADYLNRHNILWVGEGTIFDVIEDDELIRTLAKNCVGLLAGLEGFFSKAKDSPSKQALREDFPRVAKRLRKLKFPVTWSMMFCTDEQTPDTFLEATEMIRNLGLDVNLHLATPIKGTPFYQRVQESGRLKEQSSLKRDRYHLVFKPEMMTREQAMAGFIWIKGMVAQGCEQRFAANVGDFGPKKALFMYLLEIASERAGYSRFRSMYPELKGEIGKFEEMWRKRAS